MSALLKVKGLMAGYGKVPVLHGINLEVGEGEILGVLGHNGMGKTTLLKTLMGIVPATGGQVIFDGEDLSEMKSSGRALCYLKIVEHGKISHFSCFVTFGILNPTCGDEFERI